MNILEEIIHFKIKEIKDRHELYPLKLLETSTYFNSDIVSMKKYLLRNDRVGIIAEIKRKSPSKGYINKYISVEKISIGYMQAGASALSVLTDNNFFGGSNDDLKIARKFNFCPILRKDFIIDEYQVYESKSIGADVILLIAAALKPAKAKELARLAKSLGLEVLLEVHNEHELGHINEFIDIVGVNNRDLKDFSIDLNRSVELSSKIPDNILKISESGINSAEAIIKLKAAGFRGFLIGGTFMKSSRPEVECANLIKSVNKYTEENSFNI
ncbi:MAG: indole-3-glycerol phosphate synthase TrpC [Bacteroidota bacterium]|nr:indole-3-glycerol phosphate synthase TrpC [Bacteroidota bacterium]